NIPFFLCQDVIDIGNQELPLDFKMIWIPGKEPGKIGDFIGNRCTSSKTARQAGRDAGMPLEFRKISEFRRGTLAALLTDAYSFDCRCAQYWSADWREFDDFFFEHLQIADRYGFITVLDGEAIGLASWDPRHRPEYVEIGHNCIAAKYKGHGYGKAQLQEAVDRISRYDNLGKIIVTTNGLLLPAQRMYERVGFREIRRRRSDGFSGEFIDYEYS
ncbi:N-acetyltransferase, partial [Victivallis vadensis]|uniref:GNAT family N-acetyltransferase n=1 Tax=Victivallis vadensis TaxID=172901 RepID=UPI00266D1373